MNFSARSCFLLLLWLTISFSVIGQENETLSSELPDPLESAENLRFTDPDSAIALYEAEIEQSLNEQDTLTAIQGLIGLSYLYAHTARYSRSYDGYWEALLLAEQMNNKEAIAAIYSRLGWLYSFYKRRTTAIDYFNLSLQLYKEQAKEDSIDYQVLLNDYYALATLYRKDNETNMARLYLDSCRMMRTLMNKGQGNGAFIKAEYGYILNKEEKYQAALDTLLEVKEVFEREDSSYLVVLYPFLGDVYRS
ncbi:MAG: hypothetical protein AAF992_27125, partial [Bacteroidota bacterium]